MVEYLEFLNSPKAKKRFKNISCSPNESISKSEVDDIAEIALISVKVAETFSFESTKDIDKMKFLAKEIQRIESNPKLESEFQQKISKWIND